MNEPQLTQQGGNSGLCTLGIFGIFIVLYGFPLYSRDSDCTPEIPIVIPEFSLYSQDFHRTPEIPIVLPGFLSYFPDSHITSKNFILPRMCPPYHITKNRNVPVPVGHRPAVHHRVVPPVHQYKRLSTTTLGLL